MNLTVYKPNHYLEPEQLFANSGPGRISYDTKADKSYSEALQVITK